jgi:4-hydroxy-4-methyl-2-oxoglutarate aldolase
MSTPAALASVDETRVTVLAGLEPAWPSASLLGRAFTVQGGPGDNLALHLAVAVAEPGDVIVLAVGGERGRAHCGAVVAMAAHMRGIAGVVLDGAIRDRSELESVGLPVFHQGVSPLKPGKAGPVALGVSVELAGVRIEPGDLIAADADGVVVVAAADADELLAGAVALEAREAEIVARLGRGETTVSIYGLAGPPE